jgi:signal transduction histidine kinase/ActR/RegA family two-component response regulator
VLCDAQGDARAVRGVTVDISERKRAELELERVNRALAERVQQLAVAERRQAFQLEVSDRLRRARDADTVNLEVCQLLGRHLGASRVNFGEYDTERGLVTYRSYYADGVASEQSAFPAEAFGAANLAVIAAGETWVNDDLEHDPRTCSADIWPMFKARGVYAGMMVPMNRRSGVVSCLFVQHASARRWSAEEIALVEDISQRMWNAMERVRAEEALRQADTRKDEFLAMLAHELRNPLAPISAAAELLRIGRLDPDSIRRTSQVIGRQVGHMTGLVNDLLDVSRVTRGLVELERQPLDLARVIADAVEQIRPLVEARRHHLSIRAAPGLAGLEGDHKRMVQVLANLLANAAKYTPEGGEIELCAEGVAGAVVLRVADNGSGIPAEVLPHVFDLFSQAKRTPDRSQGGLGLGLALVRSLVELHGGSVSAHSDGPGQGAEFRLWLPCAAPRERRQAGADAHDARAWFAPPMRLLIVDDNADAAGMLKLLLESSGHDVVVENSPFPALERASAERFDALLLDIGLPGMDGRELARRMRESGQSRTAVFMAVTGYGQQHDGASANDSAFDHYFVKPVDAGGLLAVLAEVHRARSSHA